MRLTPYKDVVEELTQQVIPRYSSMTGTAKQLVAETLSVIYNKSVSEIISELEAKGATK